MPARRRSPPLRAAEAGITADAFQALDVDGTVVPGTCAGDDGGLTFTFAQNSPGQLGKRPGSERPQPAVELDNCSDDRAVAP